MSARGSAVAGLLALFAVVALLEVILRIVASNAELSPRVFDHRDSPLIYGLRRNASETAFQFGRVIAIHTDPAGHRRYPPVSPGPATRVVHVIGDSMVFGWGLDDEETIPSALQRELGSGWRVVNEGVPGYGPFEYLYLLQSIPVEESVVVIFAEENDLWDAYRIFHNAGSSCGYLTERSATEGPFKCAMLHSRAVQFILSQYRRLRSLGYRPTPLQYGPDSQVVATVMASRVEAAFGPQWALRRDTLITTIVPWKGLFGEPARAEYFPPPSTVPPSTAFRDDLNMTDLFRRASQGNAAPFYLEGDSHLSSRGAALLAHRISTELRQRTLTQANRSCGC